jgi:hypothetical protein
MFALFSVIFVFVHIKMGQKFDPKPKEEKVPQELKR